MKKIAQYFYLFFCLVAGNIYSQVSTYSLTQNLKKILGEDKGKLFEKFQEKQKQKPK